jgi:hypothetical protein
MEALKRLSRERSISPTATEPDLAFKPHSVTLCEGERRQLFNRRAPVGESRVDAEIKRGSGARADASERRLICALISEPSPQRLKRCSVSWRECVCLRRVLFETHIDLL